ncbi:DUF4279 domain-containing protein [Actinoplanes sp. LDG1-06]|uniref:DUF4279 domain-containing protein n=1 Tax=Paractinoplanes ovalisporus TaxID=2810368 RepID=A0ABS2A7W0_9ACTN|nr:DUF4279 domain-containing protein [Actinoplanes ovalisporus]MBM2615910.1 DUF4279 domain-containing protein [Actinoplanes ovalisporus]
MADDEHAHCTQRAYLYLARDVETGPPPYSADELRLMSFDPDEVTRLVGLRPTRAGQRGLWRFSDWKYELAEVMTYETEEVVTSLLDAIEPYAGGIAEACATLGMRAGINVVIEMHGDRNGLSTAAITYSAHTLKRLARLDVTVDHDQYVYLPDV